MVDLRKKEITMRGVVESKKRKVDEERRSYKKKSPRSLGFLRMNCFSCGWWFQISRDHILSHLIWRLCVFMDKKFGIKLEIHFNRTTQMNDPFGLQIHTLNIYIYIYSQPHQNSAPTYVNKLWVYSIMIENWYRDKNVVDTLMSYDWHVVCMVRGRYLDVRSNWLDVIVS